MIVEGKRVGIRTFDDRRLYGHALRVDRTHRLWVRVFVINCARTDKEPWAQIDAQKGAVAVCDRERIVGQNRRLGVSRIEALQGETLPKSNLYI